MLDRFIVNTVYLVPLQVSRFRKQHPDEEVLIADATKARKVRPGSEVRHEPGWITARRGVLMLTTRNLRCGNWVIPLSSIREATLLHIPGGSVLSISTSNGDHYQFGMQRNPAWQRQMHLPCKIEYGALKFSKVSLVWRLIALTGLLYFGVQDYIQNGFGVASVFTLIIIIGLIVPLLWSLKSPKASYAPCTFNRLSSA